MGMGDDSIMPYQKPTITELNNYVAQDIQDAFPEVGAPLRFSNLGIMAKAQASLAYLQYGYLDWIAKQSNPYTCTDEFLEAWAALKGIYRRVANQATGTVLFNGVGGTDVANGTILTRSDGKFYTVTADATVSGGGTVTLSAQADAEPEGLLGAFGNCSIGTQFSLNNSIVGLSSSGLADAAFTGGTDLEDDESLRARMLEAYQNPPQGGSASDYILWSKELPTVTRAWVSRNGFGAGTVVVFFMMDEAQAINDGFPQGDDGVATDEWRGVTATGDQLTLADYLWPLQPVTALVYAAAPLPNEIDFTISGIGVSDEPKVLVAIADVFFRKGAPGGNISIAEIWAAIDAIPSVSNFVIVSPTSDISNASNAIPTVGTVTFV